MSANVDRLVYMANQIARNFEALGHEAAVKATAEHIASFWAPRMKNQIFEQLDAHDQPLCPTARAAIIRLRGP